MMIEKGVEMKIAKLAVEAEFLYNMLLTNTSSEIKVTLDIVNEADEYPCPVDFKSKFIITVFKTSFFILILSF